MVVLKCYIRDYGVNSDAFMLEAEKGVKVDWNRIDVKFMTNNKPIQSNVIMGRGNKPSESDTRRGYTYDRGVSLNLKVFEVIISTISKPLRELSFDLSKMDTFMIELKPCGNRVTLITPTTFQFYSHTLQIDLNRPAGKRKETDPEEEESEKSKIPEKKARAEKEGTESDKPIVNNAAPTFNISSLFEQFRSEILCYNYISKVREEREDAFVLHVRQKAEERFKIGDHRFRFECGHPVFAEKVLKKLEWGKNGKVEADQIVFNLSV